jgi:hypothetical protein
VTCAYQLADNAETSDDMEDRFVLAADSMGLHLITALFSQETCQGKTPIVRAHFYRYFRSTQCEAHH